MCAWTCWTLSLSLTLIITGVLDSISNYEYIAIDLRDRNKLSCDELSSHPEQPSTVGVWVTVMSEPNGRIPYSLMDQLKTISSERMNLRDEYFRPLMEMRIGFRYYWVLLYVSVRVVQGQQASSRGHPIYHEIWHSDQNHHAANSHLSSGWSRHLHGPCH